MPDVKDLEHAIEICAKCRCEVLLMSAQSNTAQYPAERQSELQCSREADAPDLQRISVWNLPHLASGDRSPLQVVLSTVATNSSRSLGT
jgi:hypothetical protein